MVFFDKCVVKINNSGIMANSAGISISPNIDSIYGVGKQNSFSQSKTGPIKNSFKLNYLMEINNELNYSIINLIKNLTGFYSGVTIEIGGVTGYNCFLSNYNFNAAPNGLINISTNYESYVLTSGSLQQKIENFNFDTGNFAHSWNCFINNTGNFETNKILSLNYSFNVIWQPVFLIGNKYPVEYHLMSANEIFNLERDIYTKLNETGANLTDDNFLTNSEIVIYGLNYLCNNQNTGINLNLNMSGSKIIQTEISNNLDDIIRVNTTLNKSY